VFGDPDEFRLARDPAKNQLYGAGIHACPGAPVHLSLAMCRPLVGLLQLRVILRPRGWD